MPVEEPADAVAPASAAAPRAQPPQGTPAPATTDPAATQTLLKPEFLIGSDEPTLPSISEPSSEAPQVLEVDPDAPLTLKDGLAVDRMLSSPPVAAPSPSAPSPTPPGPAAAVPTLRVAADPDTLTLLPDAPAESTKPAAATQPASVSTGLRTLKAGDAGPAAAPALVPLARRASLTAAAQKLAATPLATAPGAAQPPKPVAPPAPIAPVAPLKPRLTPAATAAPVTPHSKAPPPATPPSPAAPPAAPPVTPPAEAPSLASWANARAAAAATSKAATTATAVPQSVPTARPVQAAAAQKPRSAPAPARTAPAPAAPSTTSGSYPRGMDRDFIARNQIVERYLSGKLPVKAATDFERYCSEHPELLDELGLPERVNAGLRLLEASGKPEPWQESSKPVWQRPAAILGTAGVAVVLALALAIVATLSVGKSRKILELQRQVVERTLDAATNTRVIRVLPNRSGASNIPAIVIGGGAAQLVDFRIDETRSPYKDFRITIDRLDQGRVMIIDNLSKDSNGHLRVALNSSAFGPGNYLLTIEGLTMRLEPEPDSWVTIGVAQR